MRRALVVEGLRAGYGSVEILQGIALQVDKGDVLAVLGRNGVGKTTLVRTIMGVLPPRAGAISVLGRDVTGRSSHHVARAGVAYVAQEGGLFDELTVEENFRMVLPRAAKLRDECERALSIFPVFRDRLTQKAGTLSGGQRKLLMAARVLVQRAELILLDEISEGVQPSNVSQIAAALREEQARGASVLLIEQKLEFALDVASRFAVLKGGSTVAAGEVGPRTTSEVTKHLVL